MRAVPNWAVATAAAAPLLLVAGWTVAEARQPAGYDPIRDTISELAGQEAVDAWPARHCGFRAGTTPSTRAGRIRPGRSAGRWG